MAAAVDDLLLSIDTTAAVEASEDVRPRLEVAEDHLRPERLAQLAMHADVRFRPRDLATVRLSVALVSTPAAVGEAQP